MLMYLIPFVINIITGCIYVYYFNNTNVSVDISLVNTILSHVYNVFINPCVVILITNRMVKRHKKKGFPMIAGALCLTVTPFIWYVVWGIADGFKFVTDYYINDYAARLIICYELLIPLITYSIYIVLRALIVKIGKNNVNRE